MVRVTTDARPKINITIALTCPHPRKLLFLFMPCPKSLIGPPVAGSYPKVTEKTGDPLNRPACRQGDYRNDRLTHRP